MPTPGKVEAGRLYAHDPDLDIYRSANVRAKQHGRDAPIHATMRADAMLDNGGLDGYAVVDARRRQ